VLAWMYLPEEPKGDANNGIWYIGYKTRKTLSY
jgi:hypothetical protein